MVTSSMRSMAARLPAPDLDALPYLFANLPRRLRVALHEHMQRGTLLALLAAGGLRFVGPWWAALLVGLAGVVGVTSLLYIRAKRAWLPSYLGRGEDAGSARRLHGEVCYVVAIDGSFGPFAPAPGSAEDDELWGAVAGALAELQRALAWIEDQAKARGRGVAFRRLGGVLHFWELAPEDLPPKQWTEDEPRSFDRLQAFMEARARSIRSTVPHAQFFVVVLTKDRVRSGFAVQSSRDAEVEEIEHCVCPIEFTAVEFAHEVLHLFGARDLYQVTRGPAGYVSARKHLLDLARAQVPSGTLESSIMARTTCLDDVTIDAYTERATGLTRDAGVDARDQPSPVLGRSKRSTELAWGNAVRFRFWSWTLASLAILIPWSAPRALLMGGAVAAEVARTLALHIALRR
jgi:hypothetical protein